MDLRTDPLAVRSVLFGWLAAAAAAPLLLVVAVTGQGVGALAGGCRWIGVSTAWTRAPWALVNQPDLDFAATSAAFGYWFGGTIAVVLSAIVTLPLVRWPKRLAAELLALQLAWAAATMGCGWLPLVDGTHGHPGRWLTLHELPAAWLWLLPVAGITAATMIALRLLALLRSARPHAGRGARLWVVLVQLAAPLAAWLVGALGLMPTLPPAATVAAAAPLLAALAIAWYGWPPPYAYPLTPPTGRAFAAVAVAALLLATIVWLAGAPLAGGRVAGVRWAMPDQHNNIRSWIDAVPPDEALQRATRRLAPTVY